MTEGQTITRTRFTEERAIGVLKEAAGAEYVLCHRNFRGLLVGLVVHAANIQDRDGAPAVLGAIRNACPWLRHVFADGGYAGPKLRGALDRIGTWTIEIVKRSDTANGFELIPRRWVVERTFAWLGRCRRLGKGWEKSIASAEA